MKHGKVIRPWLGVKYVPLTNDVRSTLKDHGVTNLPRQNGDLVMEVYNGSPAAEAGLRPQDDVILKVNGKPVAAGNAPGKGEVTIADEISRAKVGDLVTMEVWHISSGRTGTIGVRVAEMPADFGDKPE